MSARPVSSPARFRRTFDEAADKRIVALVNGPRLKLRMAKLSRGRLATEAACGAWNTASGIRRDRGGALPAVPLACLLVSSNTRLLTFRNGWPEEQ